MDLTSQAVRINFAEVPAKALNVSSRIRLSWYLNPEQLLLSSNSNIARDYRGLAELMGFEYNDIKNFQRNEDPTSKILEAWEANPQRNIAELLEMLEKMGRHDVIEEVSSLFEKDAEAYLRNQKQRIPEEFPIQVPEVSSCRTTEPFYENPNILTIGDAQTGELTKYDAYVCYAEEDSHSVYNFAAYLESPEIGIKLCIKSRDLLGGTSETDAPMKLIEERCNRMLVMLSPHFLKSPACEFYASFAAGLAIEQQRRKLIPVVLAPCEIPLILRFVSKIDFSKPDLHQWKWDKLITSIRGSPSRMFVSPHSMAVLPEKHLFPQLEQNNANVSNPIITFPPTINIAPGPSCSAILSSTSTSTAGGNSTITSSTKQGKWYHNLKEKFARNTNSSSSASSATSGFHSQSGDVFDSMDNG